MEAKRLLEVVLTAGYDTFFKFCPVLALLNAALIVIITGIILSYLGVDPKQLEGLARLGNALVYLIAYVWIGFIVRTIRPKRRDVNE